MFGLADFGDLLIEVEALIAPVDLVQYLKVLSIWIDQDLESLGDLVDGKEKVVTILAIKP